jgi:hypothetical protein
VIDRDTIVVARTHIRLNGVDAPEIRHPEYDRMMISGRSRARRCGSQDSKQSALAGGNACRPKSARAQKVALHLELAGQHDAVREGGEAMMGSSKMGVTYRECELQV